MSGDGLNARAASTLNWRSKWPARPACSSGFFPSGFGGEFVSGDQPKARPLQLLQPLLHIGMGGHGEQAFPSASTSAASTATPWTAPTISKTPRPSEKKSS